MSKNHVLTKEELNIVKAEIAEIAPGRYILRELLHRLWKHIYGPTDFGIRFKQSVRAGLIAGIRLDQVTPQNHQAYLVID